MAVSYVVAWLPAVPLLEATRGPRAAAFNRLMQQQTADAVAQGVDLFTEQNNKCDSIRSLLFGEEQMAALGLGRLRK